MFTKDQCQATDQSLRSFPFPVFLSLPHLPSLTWDCDPSPAMPSAHSPQLPCREVIIHPPIVRAPNPCHSHIHHITATATGELVQQVGRPPSL